MTLLITSLIYVTLTGKTRHVTIFLKIVIAPHTNSTIYYRTNIGPNLREIALSLSEILRLLCVHARTIELEKVRSKYIAKHMGGISVYYAYPLINSGWGRPN